MTAADNVKSTTQSRTEPDATSVIANGTPQLLEAAPKTAVHSTSLAAVAKELPKTVCSECRVVVETPSRDSTLIATAPSLLSGALVITGWFIVNRAQANRERRKQIREFGAGLIKDLAELEKAIVEYHTTARNESSEQALISKLTRFEKACGLFPNFLAGQFFWKATAPESLKVSPSVIQKMRKAMTLKHFSDEHEGPVNCTDPLVQEIEIATNEVQEALEAVRLASLD